MNVSSWGSQYPMLDAPLYSQTRPWGDWATCILNDSLALPFAATILLICVQMFYALFQYATYQWRSRGVDMRDTQDEVILRLVNPTAFSYFFERNKDKAGIRIFRYTMARLLGCLTVLILSIKRLLDCSTVHQHGSHSPRIFSECPESFVTLTFIYSSLLAIISMSNTKWATIARRSNIVLLLGVLGVYLYRDIWPLATYTEEPKDSQDKLIWYKMVILTFTSVVVPLFIPRHYIPVDPMEPMPVPNDEQTCSIISLILYSYLDPVILLGYRERHMKPEQLPPLSDTDWTKNLVRNAFPHLDPYSGAKRRHLFFGLFRVFRKEYCMMAISIIAQVILSFFSPIGINRILTYLESGGVGATIRPWFWILCIFVGPTLNSISFQGYIFMATRSLARTEAIITQLVFEHSLRIRFIAETGQEVDKDKAQSNKSVSPIPGTPAEPIDPSEIPNEDTSAITSTKRDSTASGETEETLAATSTSAQGKSKDNATPQLKAEAPSKKDSNLIGKLNNLVTTDLDNIVDALSDRHIVLT